MFVLKVNGITENYVNHYIYMNMNYYNQIMGETSYNALILNMDGEAEEVGNHLMESGLFSGIQYSSDTMEMFEDVDVYKRQVYACSFRNESYVY